MPTPLEPTVQADRRRYQLVLATDRVPAANLHASPQRRALRALLPALADQDIALATTDGLSAGMPGVFPVVVSQQTLTDYRDGHCATTLGPLYHGRTQPPVFDRAWREAYRGVNRRYADVIAGLAAPHGCVWVHDYPLQLVPEYLRRLRPDLRIGLFMHAPFPPAELFAQLPGRDEILAGLLGADVVAFQHSHSAANFIRIAAAHESSPARTRAITLPMPADTRNVQRLAADPRTRARATAIRAALHSPRAVLLSIANWDSGDGVRQQLDAFAHLLAHGRLDPRRTALIHLAAAKADTPAQRRLRADLERRIAQINGTHAQTGRCVIHYMRGDIDIDELVAYYLAADVLLATPLHPSSAMTACEYAAARADGTGQIILSDLSGGTGAELPHAARVNPHDIDALAGAIGAAAALAGRANPGMEAMHRQQIGRSVVDWAGRLLRTLQSRQTTSLQRFPLQAILGDAERQTQREPADRSHPDGLTVAAPHP